jgi:hypothetical protein
MVDEERIIFSFCKGRRIIELQLGSKREPRWMDEHGKDEEAKVSFSCKERRIIELEKASRR